MSHFSSKESKQGVWCVCKEDIINTEDMIQCVCICKGNNHFYWGGFSEKCIKFPNKQPVQQLTAENPDNAALIEGNKNPNLQQQQTYNIRYKSITKLIKTQQLD